MFARFLVHQSPFLSCIAFPYLSSWFRSFLLVHSCVISFVCSIFGWRHEPFLIVNEHPELCGYPRITVRACLHVLTLHYLGPNSPIALQSPRSYTFLLLFSFFIIRSSWFCGFQFSRDWSKLFHVGACQCKYALFMLCEPVLSSVEVRNVSLPSVLESSIACHIPRRSYWLQVFVYFAHFEICISCTFSTNVSLMVFTSTLICADRVPFKVQ